MTDDTSKRIMGKLKQIRLKKGLTQAEVAKKVGTNVNYYAKIERGDSNPSLKILGKIAKVLGLDLDVV